MKFDYNHIKIENSAANDVTIRIQGYIGLPEWADEWMDEEQLNNTKDKMRAELEAIQNIKSKRITVEIDSFGGAIDHALSIYDALRSTGASVTTKYIGWSASAATVIGMAGDKRISSENMYLLIHQVRGGVYGTVESIKNAADFYDKLNNRLADIYSSIGGVDRGKIVELMAVDGGEGKWLNADEAKEYGLITEVTQSYKAVAYTKSDLQKNKLPIDNLNFEHKMENTIKDGILNLLGFKSDEALTAENAQLTERITSLQAAVDSHPTALQAIQDRLTAANETLTASQEQVTALTSERDSLTAENATLLEQIQALKDENEALKNLKPFNTAGADPSPAGNTKTNPLIEEIKDLLKNN